MNTNGGPAGVVPAVEQTTNTNPLCEWIIKSGPVERPCAAPTQFTVETTRCCGRHVAKAIEGLAPGVYEEHGSPWVQVTPDSVLHMIQPTSPPPAGAASTTPPAQVEQDEYDDEPTSQALGRKAMSDDPFSDGRNYS